MLCFLYTLFHYHILPSYSPFFICYKHRMDPSTPIEETMACLKELIAEGNYAPYYVFVAAWRTTVTASYLPTLTSSKLYTFGGVRILNLFIYISFNSILLAVLLNPPS